MLLKKFAFEIAVILSIHTPLTNVQQPNSYKLLSMTNPDHAHYLGGRCDLLALFAEVSKHEMEI